ncbi:hypothetical protein HETIRDRAFT_101226 [Heterobasidion irregulare TC 32-1]|uniref:Uncharacterized protein n=1 Tax=Heterobasidion irregulare (strain TC 32-1) TaxID=747525 RepID=W4K921_HETIT|nr:uncharacterized protein HETIRDRAFT_101226 [Heterobasidion irregulare TC 32-1]ETW82322.1 hypothetical protein HETIRDRAFT_101226 [Heterobasidion irregulare TC 32-1]
MCTWVAWLESRGGLGETVSDVELSAGIRDGCWGEKRGGRGDVGVRDEGVWLSGRWTDIKGPAVEDSTGAVPAERINELIRLLARPTVPALCTRRGRAPAHGKKGAQGGLVAVVELEVGAAVGMLVVVVGVVVEGGRNGREEDSGGDERPPPRKFPLRNARLGESGAPRCCAWSFLPAPRPLRARRCQQPRRPSPALYSLAVRPLPGLIYILRPIVDLRGFLFAISIDWFSFISFTIRLSALYIPSSDRFRALELWSKNRTIPRLVRSFLAGL